MSLQKEVMLKLKEAMLNKNAVALESLRAIKSELLLLKTKAGVSAEISKEEEIKLLQKMVKQRKESAAVYTTQGRDDLAEPELQQIKIIEQFLPEQLSVEEIETVVSNIIAETGASSMKDMGKVMGMASKQLAGKADGKTISMVVKQQLQ